MKDKTTEDGTEVHQRMFECPPHIMPELSKILEGEMPLTPTIQRQMVAHLRNCDHCQIAVEIMVAASLQSNTDIPSQETARKLLKRLEEVNRSTQEQEERIAAYAEVLVTHGPEEASRRFPAFTEHLKHCQACEAKVEDTRIALREAMCAGLIPPLEVNTWTRR